MSAPRVDHLGGRLQPDPWPGWRLCLFFTIQRSDVVAAGGSAFTNGNSLPPTSVAGYGENTVSGVMVTNIAYNVDTADANKLASIVFTENEDVTGAYVAMLTINGPTGPKYFCDRAIGTITCQTPGTNVANVNSIGLTVTEL